MDGETSVFFKSSNGNIEGIEIAGILKKRTAKVLEKLISGAYRANDPEIESIDLDLLTFFSPKKYAGKESAEVKYVQSFESLMASVGKWLGYNPTDFTTLRFYQTLQIAKEATKSKR